MFVTCCQAECVQNLMDVIKIEIKTHLICNIQHSETHNASRRTALPRTMFKWISFVLSLTEINVLFILYLFYIGLDYYSYSSACIAEKCIESAENRLNVKCLRIRLNLPFLSFFFLFLSMNSESTKRHTTNRDIKKTTSFICCTNKVCSCKDGVYVPLEWCKWQMWMKNRKNRPDFPGFGWV